MKHRTIVIMILIFSLLCLAVFSFFRIFMVSDGDLTFLLWESAVRLNEDGTTTPITPDELGQYNDLNDGQWYRVTASTEKLPSYGYLLLETTGIEQIVRFNGAELSSSLSDYPFEGLAFSDAKLQVPLPDPELPGLLEIDFRVIDPDTALSPPLARVTTQMAANVANMGYANVSGITSGAFALAFLLISGLFLMGLCYRTPDYALLLLILASAILTFHNITSSQGYYFLADWMLSLFLWAGFARLTPFLLLGYLFLRRGDGALVYFRNITLSTFAVLILALLISRTFDGYLYQYVLALIEQISVGFYQNIQYLITMYLTLVCTEISIYCFARNFAKTKANAETLQLQNHLMMQNYQELSRKNRETAALRHEWKRQLTALNYIHQSGNLQKLEEKLNELTDLLESITPKEYADHFAINSILQYADERARQCGVVFSGSASVPKELSIDESDLCTLLLNMLDNALEAASKVSDGKILCRIQYVNDFFSIFCENSYDGQLELDDKGRIQTRKSAPSSHGFGLSQMSRIAQKYHSILDISYDKERFTVQTSLKL